MFIRFTKQSNKFYSTQKFKVRAARKENFNIAKWAIGNGIFDEKFKGEYEKLNEF